MLAPPTTGPTVFVRDMDPRFQRLLVTLIAKTLDVDAAASGSCRELLVSLAPRSLVLLDLRGGGRAWVPVIKQRRPQTIVVGMSVDDEHGASSALGCDGFLLKPFGLAELHDELRRWFSAPLQATRRTDSDGNVHLNFGTPPLFAVNGQRPPYVPYTALHSS